MPAQPTRVRWSGSPGGEWEFVEAPPAPALAGLVRGYTGFVERSATPLCRRETPSGTAVLIINFGAPLDVGAPGRPTVTHRGSFVARLTDLPATTAFVGTSAGIQVDFTPLGIHRFCGLAVHELPEPAVALDDVLGPAGRRLTEMLAGAPDWETRFDLLDEAIVGRFAATRAPTPSVAWAWNALEASGGRSEVGWLSDRLGCSRRHLIAGFRDHIGVTPKVAARILRFERAARLVRTQDTASLAQVAMEAGYHDQAHMTREFRRLSGLTPAAYRAARLPNHQGVAAFPDG